MRNFKTWCLRSFKWLVVTSILLILISQALSYVQQRKIRYNLFTDAHLQANDTKPIVLISSQNNNYENLFDADDIEIQLTKMFMMALSAQTLKQPKLLEQVFSDQALTIFRNLIDDTGFTIVLGGKVQVDFVQQNGSLILGSGQFEVASISQNDSNKKRVVETVDVALVLKKDALNWKLSSFEVIGQVDSKRQIRNNTNTNLYGVNYYPKSHQWSGFWPNLDITEIDNDLSAIKALSANSVRVFLNYEDFKNTDSKHFNDLKLLLQTARKYSLTTVLTLFDLKPAYNLQSFPDDLQTLSMIMELVQNGGYDVILDLKNEIDLDFKFHDENFVRMWLETLLHYVGAQSNLPVTIGWSSSIHALEYANSLDILSYHDYAPISLSSSNLSKVKEQAKGKPIFVSEIGVTSAEVGLGIPSDVEKQARQLEQRMNENSKANGIAIWTLYDFKNIDSNAIGRSPWRKFLQKNYGLITQENIFKPSSSVVRKFFEAKINQ